MNPISTADSLATCPFDAPAQDVRIITADDVLVLPMGKRMVVQYMPADSGGDELHLFYGDKDISFDEPELFAFGEQLARQQRFRAGDAGYWGPGYDWERLRDLLTQLVAEDVLAFADSDGAAETVAADRDRPSPLPPAVCAAPRSWNDCEAITRDLTGQAVELGHLELIVPIFRVAHATVDADGRQVGEANVFPRALRLEVPTDWMTCIYAGTRYQSERPMNATALKGMRAHWPQMMAALRHIRAAFLRRFPAARDGWTVGHLERLATLVLAVPSYQVMRGDRPLGPGELHPALSSLFRVTDGLRMVMHQMLFVPIGEPTLSPDAPMTRDEILAYAERNYSFHSETGVCAGPKLMVREFLGVLIDGEGADDPDFSFDLQMADALSDIETAFDYGLLGLRAYAVTFSLWPAMTRAYEHLAEIVETVDAGGNVGFGHIRDRLRSRIADLRTSTFLAKERWRADREAVYADMYEACGRALSEPSHDRLAARLAPADAAGRDRLHRRIVDILATRGSTRDVERPQLDRIAGVIAGFVLRTQATLRAATTVQTRINRLLNRDAPQRPFSAADLDVHNLLQGAEARRLPYLLDEIEALFGLRFAIDPDRTDIAVQTDMAAAQSTHSGIRSA